MKHRGAGSRGLSEGALMAAALGLILLAALALYLNRLPAAVTVAPVHSVSLAADAGALDLNLADAAQLEALPGVGPVLAARIVAYRAENGAFADVDALLDVPGVGPATLEKLRARVRAG